MTVEGLPNTPPHEGEGPIVPPRFDVDEIHIADRIGEEPKAMTVPEVGAPPMETAVPADTGEPPREEGAGEKPSLSEYDKPKAGHEHTPEKPSETTPLQDAGVEAKAERELGFKVGDSVMRFKNGAPAWSEPRVVRAVEEDKGKKYVRVEGSLLRYSLDELTKEKSPVPEIAEATSSSGSNAAETVESADAIKVGDLVMLEKNGVSHWKAPRIVREIYEGKGIRYVRVKGSLFRYPFSEIHKVEPLLTTPPPSSTETLPQMKESVEGTGQAAASTAAEREDVLSRKVQDELMDTTKVSGKIVKIVINPNTPEERILKVGDRVRLRGEEQPIKGSIVSFEETKYAVNARCGLPDDSVKEIWSVKKLESIAEALPADSVSEETPLREAAAAGAESKEGHSIAEKLGSTFVALCKKGALYNIPSEIGTAFPDARVRKVFSPTSAHAEYWLEESEVSSTRSLLIEIGNEAYMLPDPMSPEEYDTTSGFTTGSDVRPKSLTRAVAARMRRVGQRWEVAEKGVLG